MAKTSKGVILSQASQIKSDYSFALIKATADNKSLVQDASSAELKVNALVEYSKDSQWDPKKLTNLGFPAGCFLIVDLRGQDIHAADLITNLALVRQYGYQAGVIDDLSTLDDIKALKANQIYLINSGKTNDDQDASLNGNEITDGSGKLAVGMSVKWQRDYTNVDVSGDHAGFVGMGQDTLLKGGNAFGYSTNGRDFNAVITPKGLIFRRPDAERMWRLLKPNEIADINSTVGDKVKKEVDSATAEIPAAVSAANSAVSAAESAIAASKVNSDAIVAQSEAISEAKSAMDSATAEIQQLKANAASDVAAIEKNVANVQADIQQAQASNASVAAQLNDVVDQAKSQDKTIKSIQDTVDGYATMIADASGNATMAKQTADSATVVARDAQHDINVLKVDAKGLHDTLTGQGNQLASLNVTLNSLDSKYSGITGDLQSKQTALSTEQQQTKDMLLNKADKSEVDSVKGTVNQVSAEQKLMADQISSKVSAAEYQKDKTDTITAIQKNSTAIDETNKLVSIKADKTEINSLNNTAQQISSRLDILAGEVKSKVDETRVNNIVDGKGYATTSTVQSLITQKAGTINESITNLDAKYNTTVTQVQSLTASIDGLQSNVTNFKNDTSSQITQLSNAIQSKVSASDFNDLKDKTTWKSTDSIDLNTAVSQQKIFVKGGSNLPPGSYWWYVQVEAGYDSRIVQYAVSDRDNIHYSRQYDGSKWSAWSQGATESEITQLRDDINLRVKSGDLLSQINLTAHNTLIQSNKIYLDSSSTVFSGRAFIPSAAIASLSADKITTGLLNTNNINLGDGRTRLMADHDNFYIQPAGSASSNSGIRMGYDSLSFMTNDIPNGYGASVPYYSINYDGSSNGSLNIQTFDHINPGGATSTQNWYSMSGLISLSKKQIDFATNNNIHMHIDDGGVTVQPTLFFGNSTWNGTWAGFTRQNNSNTVEFNTGDNNGENFHINSGARFMQYVYINGYARAQGWLTNSTLSKKTNIKKLDQQVALDKIRQDDQYLYEYKRNVAQGIYDPQASFIIDDVNDVSHYSVPREFIDQTGNYREPNVELAYLIAAFQAIDNQVQLQQAEIKELKEKLQHE